MFDYQLIIDRSDSVKNAINRYVLKTR